MEESSGFGLRNFWYLKALEEVGVEGREGEYHSVGELFEVPEPLRSKIRRIVILQVSYENW